MKRFPIFLIFAAAVVYGQTHPLQELIDAARADSPRLKELLDRQDEWGNRLPELNGRDGVAVWGRSSFSQCKVRPPLLWSLTENRRSR
jgi:hypothetical protein